VESFDQAFAFFEKGGRSYLTNIYYKAQVLFLAKEDEAGESCLAAGLSEHTDDNLLCIMLNALKHSRTLDDEESLNFIANTAIPELLEAGRHLIAIDYCEKLKEYFAKNNKFKLAYKYAETALYYHKKIMEGDIT
jgi:hypothetical protein